MSKILIIANDFPPPVNGGNMRVYKFCKYLLKHGWKVHVLCNSLDKANEVEQNHQLSKDLRGIVFHNVPKLFYRQKKIALKESNTIIASNHKPYFLKRCYHALSKYMVPDMQRAFWVNRAKKEAEKIIETESIFYVLTSSPPHSTQIIGLKLKKKFGKKVKWIADFRDFWSLSHIYDMNLAKNRNLNKRLERKVLHKADNVIFVSEGIQNKTIHAFNAEWLINKSTVIHNGYDPDDFENLKKTELLAKNKIHFCYVGTMFGAQTHHKLLEGILHFSESSCNKILFHFVGLFDDVIYKKSNNCKNIIFHSPLKHSEALSFMNSSDVCILILTNDEEGKVAYSGKFFEYLKINKPMLSLVPRGEVSELVEKYNLGLVVNPNDEQSIANAISALCFQLSSGGWDISPNKDFLLDKFNREQQTKKLEQFITV